MSKNRKHINKKKKIFSKHNQKKKKISKDYVPNKKAIFNRYKDKQKVEEELSKKKKLEERFKSKNVSYSQSESEEEPYEQLVSCFDGTSKNRQDVFDTDESSSDISSMSEISEHFNDEISDNNDKLQPIEIMETDDNKNDIDSNDDPFTKHLQYELEDDLYVSISHNVPVGKEMDLTWPTLGNLSIFIPQKLPRPSSISSQKISILEDITYAPLPTCPHLVNKVDFNKMHIKTQIHSNIVPANKLNLIKRDLELSDIFTPLQKELFSIINNYHDIYYSGRTFGNADEIRFTYCLHVVNHILKSRLRIVHHNAKLAKNSDVPEEYRDQGLVRPKVLILAPFKDAAYRIVKTLINLVVPKEAGQVVNKKRFEDDFTGENLIMPTKNPKPEDYELLFSGNTDDTFRLGMTLTKKTLKLYTDFYSSDILVASPLGLRMIIGAEGEEDRDFDFLSSIELLILDQTDVFLMQNWDHLLHVLDHMHLQPKKTHGTDFSRVRLWAVNGWAKYYRQTLIFSSVELPEIKAILNRRCRNYAGKVIVKNTPENGSIQQVLVQVPQLFQSFNPRDILSSIDTRFEFFVKEVLPKQRDPLMSHTLIYVPSYFDFVRIRNYFKKEDISFVQICEYSKDGKIARARDMFFHTEAHFLLYSERVHFFRRFRIKGIRHIIFYQPPTYPHFYSEMCNLMQEINQNKYGGSSCNMTVTTIACQYDMQRMAAIVGAARLKKMVNSDKSVHMFVTGDR